MELSNEKKQPVEMVKKMNTLRRKKISRSARAGLVFPVGRVHRMLKRSKYVSRVGDGPDVYMVFFFCLWIFFGCNFNVKMFLFFLDSV